MAGQTYTQTSQKELWYLAWKKKRTQSSVALTLGIFPHSLANMVQSTFTYSAQQTINWLVHNIQEIISYSVLHMGIILRLEVKINPE